MNKNAANVSQYACVKYYHLGKFLSRGTGHSGLGQGHENDLRGGSVFAGTLVSAGCGTAYRVMGPSLGSHEAPGTRYTRHMILG